MKLLALPKSEVDIIPNDISLETKTFTYYLGDSYPSLEMAKCITDLSHQCKKKVRIFSPIIEFTKEEYQQRINERERFFLLSNQTEIIPKENIILDNYKFEDCFIKSASTEDNEIYHCAIAFSKIIQINYDT